MTQRLTLDQLICKTYYCGAVVLLLINGCRGYPGRIGPAGLEPLDAATASNWAAEFQPQQAARYDLRWTYTTQRGSVRGRASVRVAPPDSLRFDYRGPFGRSGAAVVVGDGVIWSEPEEDVDQLIPVAPLFWAALGVAREPPADAAVFGLETATQRIWQYVTGGDTLSYVVTGEPPYRLQAEMRSFDAVVGLVELEYDDSTRAPVEATMSFPASASIFLLSVENLETVASFGPDTWKRPPD
ncbi:MAG: hypothetical protein JSW71_23800 [Gemmatimonadota bacterium]|nr:MAG: hypothetical protein JSW71_23800 [Gemmatimonadota bacterium]